MTELWKDVVGYEGLYQISDRGNVKSLARPVYYERVCLHKNGEKKRYLVHRLVAQAFIPNVDSTKIIINHIDGNKRNNNVQNLEWCDYSRNNKHAFEIGHQKKNEESPLSKLTNDQVKEIRRIRSETQMSYKKIAQMFNVSKTNVMDIVKERTWKGI